MFVGKSDKWVERPGLRSELVRQANLTAILRELHLGGASSRSELVARTGLTRSAVGALVGELAQGGRVVEERAISDGSPGRPSPVVRADAAGNVVLGLEIAVDVIGGAVVGLGGVTHVSRRIDRVRGRTSVVETVHDLVALVDELERDHGRPIEPLGIGVAVVGLVHRRDNLVAIASNLGWRDVPLGQLLADALAVDTPISLANEADLAGLAEIRRGAAVGIDDVVFVSGEVGVGGGVVSGGRPIIGRAGFAGEIGHLPVNPAGRACRCGSTGCWETEVGEGTLLERAGRPTDGGRPAVDALLADAAAGEATALEALAVETHWLAVGLAALVNLLNPQTIVLGGVFGHLYPFVIDGLRADLSQRALHGTIADLTIVPSSLGLDGPLIGAAELAFEAVLADPLGDHGHRPAVPDP